LRGIGITGLKSTTESHYRLKPPSRGKQTWPRWHEIAPVLVIQRDGLFLFFSFCLLGGTAPHAITSSSSIIMKLVPNLPLCSQKRERGRPTVAAGRATPLQQGPQPSLFPWPCPWLCVVYDIVWGVTKRCKTLSGHNVVEGKDFKNTA